MEILDSLYIKSKRKKVMKTDDIGRRELLRQGYHESSLIEDWGQYFVKPSEARLYIKANGDWVFARDFRKQICNLYGLKRLTEARFKKFVSELKEGKLKLQEMPNHEIAVVKVC